MPLPTVAAGLAAGHLAAVDAAVPGLVTALWITGSAASEDWREARSDVDFVAGGVSGRGGRAGLAPR